MVKKKILLLGGSGLLGSGIARSLKSKYHLEYPTRGELDLRNSKDVKERIARNGYDVIIYSAGLTNQDECEKNKDKALFLNSKIVKDICIEAKKAKTNIIYFSTEAVFPCNRVVPYKESDRKNPINYYGMTKALGEDHVLRYSDKNSIIRLVSIYTPKFTNKIDFTRRIIEAFSKGEEVIGVSDQLFNPTFSECAVKALGELIDRRLYGVFHVGAEDSITNLDFVKLIEKTFNFKDVKIKSVNFADFFRQKPAKRGQFNCLDVTNSKKIFGKDIIRSNKLNLQVFKTLYYSS